MDFFRNLWKTQPNTVLGGGAAIILIGAFSGFYLWVAYEDSKNIQEIKVQPYKLTPQEVVDKYEFEMRRVCKEQIQLKLDTPDPYKVKNIKFTPHMMNSPASAVVDLRVNFIGRKDGNISAYFSR